MDTEIIEYGGNSITLLTLIENMYNAVETHEIENILTFTFKICKTDLTDRIEEILSPLFVYAIFQSQCKRHKTEDHCKLDKKCHWNSTDNKCGWKYQPSLERDIVEAEEIINIEQSIKFFIIDEDEFLENAILSANHSSKNMIISKFVIYLDDNLKLIKFKVDKRTVDGYAKLIKIGTEDSLDVNLINKKLFLQIFVSKISNYLKIWEQNVTLSEDKSDKDSHNLKRLQILIENLTKFDSFCKKTEWLIDNKYKERLSSFISVLKNIKLNAETHDGVSGGYEEWINTFIVHSLHCNLQLQYDIRYGIIAYKLVAMMRNLLRNHPSLFSQTGGLSRGSIGSSIGSTLSETMTMKQDRREDVIEALLSKEGIPEDHQRLIFGNTGQILLTKKPKYSKIEAQHTAQKEQAIKEAKKLSSKKLSSEELAQKISKRLGMTEPISISESQPTIQTLETMCNDIENVVDPQIYAKIRILKCGTVTEADIKAITEKLANLSLDSTKVENVDEVKEKVTEIRKTQGTKVKSEVDSEESYGLDKLYSDEDLNTISNVTEIDSKDAPLVVTIVDESAENEVSDSLDKKFETYGLEDLFAPVEESTAPVEESTAPVQESTAPVEESTAPVEESTAPVQESTAPVEESTAPVEESTAPVQESTAPVEESTAPVQESTAPVQELTAPVQELTGPPASPQFISTVPLVKTPADLPPLIPLKIKKPIDLDKYNFGVQEIINLPPKDTKPEKPMSRYQKLYAIANNVSNMVTSPLEDIIHPYKGIIKYRDNLITLYADSREHTASFFEYIIKGFKLVLTTVPGLCYDLIKLLLVSLYNFVNTGVINIETILKNIYKITSNYFINPAKEVS